MSCKLQSPQIPAQKSHSAHAARDQYCHTPVVQKEQNWEWREGEAEAKNTMGRGRDLPVCINHQLQSWMKRPRGENPQAEGKLTMLHCTVANPSSLSCLGLSHSKCVAACLQVAQCCEPTGGMLCLHVGTSLLGEVNKPACLNMSDGPQL